MDGIPRGVFVSALVACMLLGVGSSGLPSQDGAEPPARATISGLVIDAAGEPIPACSVELLTLGGDRQPVATTLTDGDGIFVISRLLENGSYRLQASSPRRVTVYEYVGISDSRRTRRERLQLWDAGTIRGRVVDAAGEPVAGAEVVTTNDAARVFAFEPTSRAETDSDGRFGLRGASLGDNQVRAWKAGYLMGEASTWLSGEDEIEIRLERGSGVRLEVAVDGLPEGTEARLSIMPYGGGGYRVVPDSLLRGSVTSATSWVREGLPDLEYRVRLRADGHTFAPDEARQPAGAGPHRVVFQATKAPKSGGAVDERAIVRGVLRDGQDRPLADERLVCRHHQGGRRAEVVTDSEGRFELVAPRAPGTPCVIYLVGSDYVMAQEKDQGQYGSWDARFRVYHEFVVGEEAELDVRAAPTATVSGRLMDHEGHPVRWTRVELQAAEPNRSPKWMSQSFTESDENGRFRFRNLNPPDADLRVVAGGAETGASVSESFSLMFGDTQDGIEIVVAGPGVVRGQVLDANGAPRPGVRVWLRSCDPANGQRIGGSVREVLADRQGRYGFIDVEPGGHLIQLPGADRMPGTQSEVFEVGSGETVDVPIRLD